MHLKNNIIIKIIKSGFNLFLFIFQVCRISFKVMLVMEGKPRCGTTTTTPTAYNTSSSSISNIHKSQDSNLAWEWA